MKANIFKNMKKKVKYLLLILLTLIIFEKLGTFEYFNNKSYDLFTTIRNQKDSPVPPITIIKIDNKSFGNGNQPWPWNRRKYVKFIQNIQEQKPTVIGFDILFTNSMEETGDNLLAKELSKHNNIVLSSKYGERTRIFKNKKYKTLFEYTPTEKFQTSPYGFVNAEVDKDGVYRKNKVSYKYIKKTLYSFAFTVLEKHLKLPKKKLIKKYIPLNKLSNKFFVNYVPFNNFYQVSFIDTLNKKYVKKHSYMFKNRIILVGATSSELNDILKIPGNIAYPGVALHGSTIWQMIKNKWITPIPSWLNLITTFIIIIFSIFVFSHINLFLGFMIVFLSTTTLFFFSLFAFKIGDLLINPFVTIIAIIISYLACILSKYFKEIAEKKEITNIFGRYVSKDLINEILENKENLNLGGELKRTAILFSDIKSFTTMSENNPPETIVTLLNQYFAKMVEILFDNDGSLDKFIGDAVMATFGVPMPVEYSSFKAVVTAMEMQEALIVLNKSFVEQNLPLIEIRIGVNTGNVVAGNIGSEERMEYTVMGDTVNLAARLEGKNKDYGTGILISEFTYEEVKDYIKCKYIDKVIVKGKSKAVKVYQPLEIIALPKIQ